MIFEITPLFHASPAAAAAAAVAAEEEEEEEEEEAEAAENDDSFWTLWGTTTNIGIRVASSNKLDLHHSPEVSKQESYMKVSE